MQNLTLGATGMESMTGNRSSEASGVGNGTALQGGGTDKVIRITCEGKALMPLSEIKELQGQLKELSVRGYEKLKRTIAEEGFAFPLEVAVIEGKPYGILDGHQRLRTVRQMTTKEGYSLPGGKLPVSFTQCKDKAQAGRLILHAISQFAKTQDEGLYEFANEFKIDPKSLTANFDIPDFDAEKFVEGYYGDVLAGTEKAGTEDDEPKLKHECPKCGHRY